MRSAVIPGHCEICDATSKIAAGVHPLHCEDRRSDTDWTHAHWLCWRCALQLRKYPDGTVRTFPRCPDTLADADHVLLALQRGQAPPPVRDPNTGLEIER